MSRRGSRTAIWQGRERREVGLVLRFEGSARHVPMFIAAEDVFLLGGYPELMDGMLYVNLQGAPRWFLDVLFEGGVRVEHRASADASASEFVP